jgi:hypothetical protein
VAIFDSRIPSLLALLTVSAANLYCSDSHSVAAALPERAGILVAYVGTQRVPVVKYRGDDPIVNMDRGYKQVHFPPISVIAGGTFGGGFVTITHSHTHVLNDQDWKNVTNPATVNIEYEATISSDTDLSDVVLVLVMFEIGPYGPETAAPKVSFLGSDLGNLKAGKKKFIQSYFPRIDSNTNLGTTALLFSGGRQIRSSYGNRALDGLFDWMDRVSLKKAISERVSGDHSLAVYRYFPLIFSDAQKKKYAGQTLALQITITASGYFDSVRIEGVSDMDVQNDLAAQLAFWLFLPPVKSSRVQPATFALPVEI